MDDNTTQLLQQLKAGTISLDECDKQIRAKESKSSINLKVTPKGCIGIYGIRRMPISLYQQELEKVFSYFLKDGWSYSDDALKFIESNNDKLKKKDK